MGGKGKRESYWQKGQQDMAALIDRTVKDQAWDGVAETIPLTRATRSLRRPSLDALNWGHLSPSLVGDGLPGL